MEFGPQPTDILKRIKKLLATIRRVRDGRKRSGEVIMLEFELPLFDASTAIGEPVFEPLIGSNISGIVIQAEDEFRLVHYTQIEGALRQGLKYLGEITGYTPILRAPVTGGSVFVSPGKFRLKAVGAKMAFIYSGSERGAGMYLSGNPGARCDAPEKQPGLPAHYYPPRIRGSSNRCVVIDCPGEIR